MTATADSIGAPGRLAPIAGLIEAARRGEVDLGPRLEECFAGTVPEPGKLFMGHALVWGDTALFALATPRQPALSFDDGEPVAMTAVPGTPYWFRLVTLEQGRVYSFQYLVGDERTGPREIAGYNALSYELPDASRGVLSEQRSVSSRIYPGATTDYWVYVNHGIDEQRGAPVMVWHDGQGPALRDQFNLRMQIVTDNLVHRGLIPPMVHACVRPSAGSDERAAGFDSENAGPAATPMRTLQYATASDRYGRHLVEELLPDVERTVKLRSDAYSRGSLGRSHGGHCAFKLAWLQPDHFSRAHCSDSTFTATTWDPENGQDGPFIYAQQVRREPRRNIRVWLSEGANDMERATGSWPLGNLELVNALKLNGYDFKFRFGEGHHSNGQAALDLPESLAWLWRDYDPDRTEQIFEQDAAEREQPPFRVSIVNRDA